MVARRRVRVTARAGKTTSPALLSANATILIAACNLADYRMMADEDDVLLLQEDEQG